MTFPAGSQTLAERLKQGALPLSAALQCCADVALALRNIHLSGAAHGQVQAAFVAITAEGCELRLSGLPPAGADRHRDVLDLGALVFEILTGSRPAPGSPPPAVPRVAGPRSKPAAIRADALRVAVRCLSEPVDGLPGIARAAAELRVLAMLATQADRLPKRRPRQFQPPLPIAAEPVEKSNIPVETPAPPVAADAPPQAPALARIEPAVPIDFLKEETPTPPRPAANPDLPDYRRCPDCGSADVHPSKPRTRGEKLGALAFKIPLYRCHQCYHRWFLLLRIAIPCKVQKVHRRSF